MRLVSTAYSALLAVASAAPAQNNWRALNVHLGKFTASTKDVLTSINVLFDDDISKQELDEIIMPLNDVSNISSFWKNQYETWNERFTNNQDLWRQVDRMVSENDPEKVKVMLTKFVESQYDSVRRAELRETLVDRVQDCRIDSDFSDLFQEILRIWNQARVIAQENDLKKSESMINEMVNQSELELPENGDLFYQVYVRAVVAVAKYYPEAYISRVRVLDHFSRAVEATSREQMDILVDELLEFYVKDQVAVLGTFVTIMKENPEFREFWQTFRQLMAIGHDGFYHAVDEILGAAVEAVDAIDQEDMFATAQKLIAKAAEMDPKELESKLDYYYNEAEKVVDFVYDPFDSEIGSGIYDGIQSAFEGLNKEQRQNLYEDYSELFSGAGEIIDKAYNTAGGVVEAAYDGVDNIYENVADTVEAVVGAAGEGVEKIMNVGDQMVDNSSDDAAVDAGMNSIIDTAMDTLNHIVDAGSNGIDNTLDTVGDTLNSALDAADEGIAGIISTGDRMIDTIGDVLDGKFLDTSGDGEGGDLEDSTMEASTVTGTPWDTATNADTTDTTAESAMEDDANRLVCLELKETVDPAMWETMKTHYGLDC